ncbi:isoflavone 7-O-glucosyltransferase 1 [Selaginella moellendorffii]|nr:isoflavone 7-O-glucosyltransferase 1 [Selaginella moellendorffii]|eukprot:XP_002962811.2 isoflavone 7-O-glucosyltransferase 1 [Selaginella moellendorffii]
MVAREIFLMFAPGQWEAAKPRGAGEEGTATRVPVVSCPRARSSECLDWLDTQEPDSVLYVAFGSIAKLSQEEFEELALGLEASKVPFLLTVRPPQFVDEGDTTVLVKNSDFYKNFVERTKGRGLVVSWALQREVLAHRAVAGFVSHCRWNSVLESVSSGVPIICWPRIYEQGLNRKIMAERCRIGVEVSDGRSSDAFVKREEIAEAIARIFSDKARKARAREFRDQWEAAKPRGAGEEGTATRVPVWQSQQLCFFLQRSVFTVSPAAANLAPNPNNLDFCVL